MQGYRVFREMLVNCRSGAPPAPFFTGGCGRRPAPMKGAPWAEFPTVAQLAAISPGGVIDNAIAIRQEWQQESRSGWAKLLLAKAEAGKAGNV